MTKYYAVKKGRIPGIYLTWETCKEQVDHYSGAIYKSFPTKEEAQAYLTNQHITNITKGLLAYVDGSFNQKTQEYGYGCVLLVGNQIVKTLSGKGKQTELVSMHNVAGEITGSLQAIAYAIENNYQQINIYYDYNGIENWANGSWKATKPGTKAYVKKITIYKTQIEINFIKVLAHSGDYLNEMADKLAKEAVGIRHGKKKDSL